MENSIRLYKEAETLCAEMKAEGFSWSEQEEKRFLKLLNEFFANPTQKYGFSSAVTFKKVNEVFEEYIKQFANSKDLGYFDFVLQCRIDCFFARFIELYDLNMVEEIRGATTRIQLSNEIEDLLDETWDEVEAISKDVAEYLIRENVNLDGMTRMTVGVDQFVMGKFIDHPDIPEREGLWIRVWITHDVDNPKRLQVRVIIVPREEGGAAMVYDITPNCKEWFDTLA